MKKTQNKSASDNLLRQKAVEHLKKINPDSNPSSTESDILKLYHELEVHRVELEIQNSELMDANEILLFEKKEREKHEEELLSINKKLEQALQINADKSRFISILAHDLRSPFSVILGYSELLLERMPELKINEIEKFVNDIKKTTQETFSLLEDLLHWARVQSGSFPFKPQILNITEVLNDTVESLTSAAEEKNIKIIYSVPGNMNLFADSYMFKTILRNLISNSIKISGNYGAVTANVKLTDSGIAFSIYDDGKGSAPENIETLFEVSQLQNTSGPDAENGFGLELILCRGFVEKHGGTIKAESISGGGTAFKFILPQNQPSVERGIAMVPGEEFITANLKILIADDNESIRMILGEMVKRFAREVLFAKSGEEAVSIFQNNPDTDLIFMDFYMPGLNGFDATQKIRQLNKDVIIFVETADTLSNITEEFAGVKINDYFPKPFSKAYLNQLIKKHFKNRTLT